MKATEFHRLWSEQAGAAWASLGLSRLPGKACRWHAQVGDAALLVYVAVNPKYGWTVQGGGDFSVNAYLPSRIPAKPEDYVEDVFDSIDFFSLWDEGLIGKRDEINRRVYEKIRDFDETELYAKMAEAYDCTPEQAKQSGLYQSELEIIAMDVDEPADALINPALHYYDDTDVSTWAELVTAAMPQVLKRVEGGVERAFDTGDAT